MQIGLLIQKYLDGGKTIFDLAKALGCQGWTVWDLRRGARFPSKNMQKKIAKALGVDVKEVEEAACADARLRDAIVAVLRLSPDAAVQDALAMFLERAAKQSFTDWHTLLLKGHPGPMLARHAGPPIGSGRTGRHAGD